jgi:hypothetical protein
MVRLRVVRALVAAPALLLIPVAARAVEGAIEINQARAEAGGVTPGDTPGFPATLSLPGHYVLTSDLTEPAGTSAIRVEEDHVAIDLAGFTIRGGHICSAFGCGQATGSGIERAAAGLGDFARVVNGRITAFGLHGIDLGASSHVEGVSVLLVGGHAISLGGGSTALANRVNGVGASGLVFAGPLHSLYADNVIVNTAFGTPGAVSVVGGSQSSGNVCGDGACSHRGWRRYYVTQGESPSTGAPTACAPGYHFASLWEIHDPSQLDYDARLGRTKADAGTGPPVEGGWIRTADEAEAGLILPTNCNAWQSTSPADYGSYAFPARPWNTSASQPHAAPYAVGALDCANLVPVWCVQD